MAKILIVGAGAYGCTVAQVLTEAGHNCLVLDRRDHIGGNCFTRYSEEAGCFEHVYGAHIFHTQNEEVWQFVNRFAIFNRYTHRVRAVTEKGVLPVPINLDTIRRVYGVNSPEEARSKLEAVCVQLGRPAENAEEHCLATIGPDLYQLLIRDYTKKQWQRPPSQLPAAIVRRLPVRFTYDDAYFDDPFQGIPIEGYTRMFGRMLEGVDCSLKTDFITDRDHLLREVDHVFYSGAIDEFFGYAFGELEYRSLRFKTNLLKKMDFQGVAVMNFPMAKIPFTRLIEHKHFHAVKTSSNTLVTMETPDEWIAGKEAYYPVVTQENLQRYERYEAFARESGVAAQVTFGGRLGRYRYYDMDQVIAAGLHDARQLAKKLKP